MRNNNRNGIITKVVIAGCVTILLTVLGWVINTTGHNADLILEVHGKVCSIETAQDAIKEDISEIKQDLRDLNGE